MGNLLTDVEIRRVLNGAADGQSTAKGTIIDMEGFDEVTFVLSLGAVTNDGVITFSVNQGDINNTSNMVASTATSGAITSDGTTIALSNKLIAITITKPAHRYLEAQLTRATENAVSDGVIAILSKARKRPTVQGATVYKSELFASPGAA